jgi:outer membrane protein assembly factor BamB
MRKLTSVVVAAVITSALAAQHASGATAWTRRGGDNQNTNNAGDDPLLEAFTVTDLKVLNTYKTAGYVNATPVITDGLLITGDWAGNVYVIDEASTVTLVKMTKAQTGTSGTRGDGIAGEFGPYVGMQATPVVATVTVPNTTGGTREEKRVYVGMNHATKTLWCLNLTKIIANRNTLDNSDGTGYFCDSPGNNVWPRSLAVPGDDPSDTLNGSLMFSKDQPIDHDGNPQTPHLIRDVLYAPSTGIDCADGQFFAMDAYTGQILWSFDPVPNNTGGTIWTTPAMNKERTLVYVTTGDCVTQPQIGAMAESLVALDAKTGDVVWHHQRRLVDTADLDIGNGPLVADVPDEFGRRGCRVVVSPDKDGCIYGFDQRPDIPQVGDPDFDPLRLNQQRVLYRQCFVPGSLNGGFNAMNLAFDGRRASGQTSGYPAGHVGADDANAFSIDVCTGRVEWASSSISNGRTDGAVVSGMVFQAGVTRRSKSTTGTEATDYPYDAAKEVQIVERESDVRPAPRVLATVDLPFQPSLGGGGLAIANGKVYVPTIGGVVVLGVVRGSKASPPRTNGRELFAGPYPHPIAPAPVASPYVDEGTPYPMMVDKYVRCQTEYRNCE